MTKCTYCLKDTTNPKFCSRSCAAKETNKVPKRKAKLRTCSDCDTLISARKSKCDACSTTRDFTLEEATYRKHHKSSAYALIRSRARASVKNEPQICEFCSYDKHVEVCHIKAIGDFPLAATISQINSRDNLKLLCPNCHWEFDNLPRDCSIQLS